MKTGIVTFAVCLLGVAAYAQTINNDSFDITVLHAVRAGRGVLQPGEYHVKPLNLAGGDAPVLVFRGGSDRGVELAAKTVPTMENRIQPRTRVLYRHVGGRYYLDRIWVKGEVYGYKFEPPASR